MKRAADDPKETFAISLEHTIEMTFRRTLTVKTTIALLLFVGANTAAAKAPCEIVHLDLSRVYENQIFPDDTQFVSLPKGWRVERSEFGAVSLLSAFGPDGAMVTIYASLDSEAKQSLEEVTASTVRSINSRDGMSVIKTVVGKTCIVDQIYEFSEIYVSYLGRAEPVRLELHSIASDDWRFQVQLWADPDDSASWKTLRTILRISKWR